MKIFDLNINLYYDYKEFQNYRPIAEDFGLNFLFGKLFLLLIIVKLTSPCIYNCIYLKISMCKKFWIIKFTLTELADKYGTGWRGKINRTAPVCRTHSDEKFAFSRLVLKTLRWTSWNRICEWDLPLTSAVNCSYLWFSIIIIIIDSIIVEELYFITQYIRDLITFTSNRPITNLATVQKNIIIS